MVKIGDKVIILPSAVDISVSEYSIGKIAEVTSLCIERVFRGYRPGHTYEVRAAEGRNRWRLRDCDFEECVPAGKQLVFDWFKE